jgi:serine O-acetyltransferase
MNKQTARDYLSIIILPYPLLLLYGLTSQKQLIRADVERWSQIQRQSGPFFWRLLLLCHDKVFRTIFYHRIKQDSFTAELFMRILAIVYRPESTLKIFTNDIGPGLFIQHGISTIIAARRIGSNCWINQQVTLGFTNNDDCPQIGNEVQIGCGAIVLGDIKVGDFAKIGAGAVIIKDVPAKCTAVGVPGRIVRKQNQQANNKLQQ